MIQIIVFIIRSAIYNCRKAGVRVYADAVINHMTGGGNDANPKYRNPNAGCATWGIKNSSLVTPGGSSGPSHMFIQSYIYSTNEYTTDPASQEFPAAHLGPTGLFFILFFTVIVFKIILLFLDFHCERPLNSWNDPLQLNAGWLSVH